jgi:hypothetical protein
MAIWQFRLDLIPEKAVRSKYDVVPITLPQSLAEDFPWWSDVQPPIGFEASIDAILPKAKAWSESMCIWGDERGDTASVCYDNDTKSSVEWIGFRVDVRNLSPAFVKDICAFAKQLGCVLLTGAYHVLEPDESTVLAAINNSTAKNYLEDPVSTLRGLKHNAGEVIRLQEKQKDTSSPKDE